MKFDNVEGLRHPTQIYEAIGHLIIFLLLLTIWKKNSRKGLVFYSFIIMYTIFRFFMEFLREDTPFLLGLTITQLLIIPILIISIILMKNLKKENLLN